MSTSSPTPSTGSKPDHTAGPSGAPTYYNAPTYVNAAPQRRTSLHGHHLLNFILLVLTALATAAACVVMLKSNRPRIRDWYYGDESRVSWNEFDSFKWFFLANAIVCGYANLAGLSSLIGICTSFGPLSSSPTTWLTFAFDFLLVNVLMSAAASATTLIWIGYKGMEVGGGNIRMTAACDVWTGFCGRVAAATIASYVGWFFLALSTAVAASALHSQRPKTLPS